MSPQPPPRPNPKQESVNRNTYIPEHVRVQMDKQMQKNLPGHLKQYAGAYMQQQVYDPSRNRSPRPVQNVAPSPTYRPVTHLNREEHYVQYHNRTGQSDEIGNQTNASPQPPQPENVSPEQAYDFIVNPGVPPPRHSLLPTDSSTPIKIALIGGALVVLLIIFAVAKSLLGGSSNVDAFITVAQDQQKLIHLATNAGQVPDLSVANKNFSATASLSLSSSKSDLISYLAKNGQKVKPDQLLLKISSSTDAQLQAAASAATYNDTYKQIMKTNLNAYKRDLKQAYSETEGPNGQKLLSNQFDQAELLLVQLEDTRS